MFFLWQSSVGWMPVKTKKFSIGVGYMHSVTMCKALLMGLSIK